MHPILFTLGPITIYTYGVALALAFAVSMMLTTCASRARLKGIVLLDEAALLDWGCWVMAGGVLGGRLWYVLLNWEAYRAQPLEVVALWHGGLVWYGGLAGGLLAQALFVARRKLSFLRVTDQVIPAVALGHAMGRLGCFANGCCYGLPTAAWWGVRFPGHPTAVVPTQLLESLGLVALAVTLWMAQRPATLARPGRVFGLYLVGYGLLRAVIENWRGDQPAIWSGLTLAQLISLGLVLLGLWFLRKRLTLMNDATDVPVHRGNG